MLPYPGYGIIMWARSYKTPILPIQLPKNYDLIFVMYNEY